MSKIRNNRKGFTMAEVLIVVAIVIVLAGISVVGVARYQRSLKQLELDGIAKEIFVAAQNHLTMAESQGYLGLKEPGEDEAAAVSPFGVFGSEEEKKNGIYYFVVGADVELPLKGSYSNPDTAEARKSVLSLMLPFASVDETVRLGGSYVIRYQKDPGLVLDVFYAEKDGRYPYNLGSATRSGETSEYSLLMNDTSNGYHGANNKGNRRNASNFNNAVLGWYGGDEAAALPTGTELKKPTLAVFNQETLRVEITNPNVGTGHENTGLKLVVKGLTSKKSKEIPLVSGGAVATASNVSGDDKSQITVILDDITSAFNHFTQLFGGDGLIPGEDLEIYAVAYNNSQITDSRNGQSESHYTNSLFAYDGDGDDLTASVGYVRHLQNLEESISGFNPEAKLGGSDVTATQLNPLSWTNAIITDSSGTAVFGSKTVFVPVSPGYSLDYKGQGQSLSGFSIDTSGTAGSAGLFGELGSDDSVSDLELIDFSVTSGEGSAGALAGVLSGTVTNVLARSSGSSATPTVTGSGSVGGLIGSISGGTVTKSAAALVVQSTGGSAGGLIGSATGGTVSASYSGGHTSGGQYSKTDFNVTGGTYAGGLIGSAGSAAITNCYSTCSVKSADSGDVYAGGLVGSSTGSISNCYSTGLVSGVTGKEGAFAGSLSGTATDCKYYMIINERSSGSGQGYEYLASVGTGTASGITALDDDPSSFNRFAQVKADGTSGSSPAAAVTYDSALRTQFGGKYDLQSVNRPGASVVLSDFVASHYGDWPSPEIWVINTPGGSTGGTGGSTGGGTNSSTNAEEHTVGAYFDVTLNDQQGTPQSFANYCNRFVVTSDPANRVKKDASGLYFTEAGEATVTLSWTGGAPFADDAEFTFEAKGVMDSNAFTYELTKGISYESAPGEITSSYQIRFTNTSEFKMQRAIVTIPISGSGEGLSFAYGGNATGWKDGNKFTLIYEFGGGIEPGASYPSDPTEPRITFAVTGSESFPLQPNA